MTMFQLRVLSVSSSVFQSRLTSITVHAVQLTTDPNKECIHRKRGRSNCEEECCAPLSKRINNLHINPGSCCNGLAHAKQSNSNEGGLTQNPEQWSDPGPSSGLPEMSDNNNVLNFMPNPGASERLEPSQQYIGNNGDMNGSPLNLSAPWLAPHPQYNPDLDATGNPYYYDNNKILYELYIERLQRCGMV